jgi:hypothetical protein
LVVSAISLLLAVLAQVTAAPPQPSASITLTLRLGDGRRQFRPGELIPIELEFTSATPRRFSVDGATYDRSGRLTIDEFVIDRIDDVSDPLLDFFGSIGGYIGGGIRGIGVLGLEPYTVKLELNDWFRFDKPGPYTLSVRSDRVQDESATPHAVVRVESNTVSFEILPRDAAWEAAAFDTARRIVDASQPRGNAREGCRMLRFLGTDAAAVEMARRYGPEGDRGCDFDYMAGLFGAPDRKAVVQAMEDGLREPDRPVTTGYLRTLSALSVYLQHPELRPAQTAKTKGRLPAGSDSSARADLIDAAMSAYVDVLTAAMPDKTERARAITVVEMQALARQRQASQRSAASREQLAATLLDLPADRQANLLEYQWQAVAGPSMVPALRRLVDAPPADFQSVPDLALRRLAQLAPAEARPLLLREIRHPRRGATLKTLASLPDAELPELDDVLVSNFEAGASDISAALVARYATGAIASRVLAAVADSIGRMACAPQGSILTYFLRVDEATGATLLDRAMTSRATGCWRFLYEIPGLRITPAVETRAIADLDEADPEVAIAAIQLLERHGSAAALEPLRAAFQRWHTTWAGRAAELAYSSVIERPNVKQAMVEDAFRQAIATGHGWLIRADALRELQALCVTDNCRVQTGQMIHEDDTRIVVASIDEPDRSLIELAQYRFTSIAALEEHLVRYPRGTAFTLQRSASDASEITAARSRLMAFAASHGLSIKER